MEKVSPFLSKQVSSLLTTDPRKRPTAEQMLLRLNVKGNKVGDRSEPQHQKHVGIKHRPTVKPPPPPAIQLVDAPENLNPICTEIAQAGSPDDAEKEGSNFATVKRANKKPSADAIKAALNSKGENKGDLLDDITSFQDKTYVAKQVNNVADDVEKLSLNKKSEEPETTTDHTRDSVTTSDDVAPRTLKLVAVGDHGIGKTNLLNSFNPDIRLSVYEPMVLENYELEVRVGDTVHQVRLFNTEGQEEFSRLR